MKTKALFAGISALTFSTILSSVSAFAVPVVPANVVTPQVVTATVCNDLSYYPINCAVTAYGMLENGLWINNSTILPLPPGVCENAYVYANYPNYFVNGTSTANCF